jgi:thiosulfate dehydrogenase
VTALAGAILGLAVSVQLLILLPAPVSAQKADETEIFTISRGGQIYDNWMSALEADSPGVTHPSYPATGTMKGKFTWRCKECHGWDYRGKDGAYGKGPHSTGIKGIRDWVGRNPALIEKIIRDKTHQYTKRMITESAIQKLALFVARGQIDMDQYIDRSTKETWGDPRRGARLYQTVCSMCHGFDGKEINFGDEKKPEYIGTVAQDDPWQTLHKIRNGQPGVTMVSMNALSVQDQVDVLAYSQALPRR